MSQLATSLENAWSGAEAEDWRQILEDHADELGRLGEGAEAMGLLGLQQVSMYVRANILSLAVQEQFLDTGQRQIVTGWPAPVLGYLQGFHILGLRDVLVQYLQDSRWPHPLSDEDGAALSEALIVTRFDIGEEEQSPRQRHAQLEDISLAIPEDVNPELLDGLLQELPRQAADFSASIQRLANHEGALADVDTAQRVAHTLKGAANTVGVSGVANLTHHLEDILLALAKYHTLATQMLSQTLTNAADCLEAMSETLVGMSGPPAEVEALSVLQEVLDWANLIDQEGIPSDDTRPKARKILPGLAQQTPLAGQDVSPEQATAAVARTHVSADLVDELLRLAGEAMILNGQLHDRLEHTQQQLRSIYTQNAIMQQLVVELEHLVDIRGVTSPLLRQHSAKAEFDPLDRSSSRDSATTC